MAFLRTCYTTLARAYQGGPLVRIRWYWAKPGAPYYPFGHCFEPVLYCEDKLPLADGVGEVPYAKRNYYNGKRPKGQLDSGAWCGTEADFLGHGTPPLLNSGKVDFPNLCGCGYRPKIGLRVKSTLLKRFVPTAFGEIAFNAKTGVGLSDTATFAGSLVYMAAATVGTETLAEIDATLALASTGGVAASSTATTNGTIAFNGSGAVAASTTATTAGTLTLATICAATSKTSTAVAATLAVSSTGSAASSSSATTAGTIAFNGAGVGRLGSAGTVLGNLVWNAAGAGAGADSTTAGRLGFNAAPVAASSSTITAAGSLGFDAGSGPPPPLFLDTFTGTAGTALTSHTPDVGGPWTATTGTYWIQADGCEPHSDVDGDIVSNSVSTADYTLVCRCTPVWSSSGNTERPDILVRYIDSNNYYIVDLDADDSLVRLFRFQAGGFTFIDSNTCVMPSGVELECKVVCSGDRITVSINGTTIVPSMGNTFAQTATGFAIRNGKVGSPPGKFSVRSITITS